MNATDCPIETFPPKHPKNVNECQVVYDTQFYGENEDLL